MTRVKFNQGLYIELPTGYRTIAKSDINSPFKAPRGKMREYPLQYFYEWSKEQDNIVIIKKSSGRGIEGIAGFRIEKRPKYGRVLNLEMLSRNSLVSSGGNVTKGLVDVAVRWLAPQLQVSTLLVESIEDLKDFYSEIGFRETGEKFYDEYWGDIFIMKIEVNRP